MFASQVNGRLWIVSPGWRLDFVICVAVLHRIDDRLTATPRNHQTGKLRFPTLQGLLKLNGWIGIVLDDLSEDPAGILCLCLFSFHDWSLEYWVSGQAHQDRNKENDSGDSDNNPGDLVEGFGQCHITDQPPDQPEDHPDADQVDEGLDD